MIKEWKLLASLTITVLLVVAGFVGAFFFLEEGLTTVKQSGTLVSSKYIKDYTLPDNSMPNALLVDNNTVWIGGSNQQLIEFSPEKTKKESSTSIHPLPTQHEDQEQTSPVMIWTIEEDQDENIWISLQNQKAIFRFDPTKKEFESVGPVSAAPFQMKINQETGNLWYTTLNKNKIGIVQKDADSFQATEFDTGYESHPSGIYIKGDKLWITQLFDNKVVLYSIIRDTGIVTGIKKELEIPNTKSGPFVAIPASPTDIIVDNHDDIWVTEHGTSFVAKHEIDTKEWKRYPTSPIEFEATALPFWLRASEHGFWFNEHTGNKIGFFNTTEMTMTEYHVPGKPSEGFVIQLLNIATDPLEKNTAWFTQWNLNKVASVNGNLPLPFDIRTMTDKITIDTEKVDTKEIKIKITNMEDSNSTKDNLYLKKSSTIGISGSFINMTAKFSTDVVPSDAKQTTVKLSLSDFADAPPGSYTIGVSVTDNTVTKTDFVELIIE